MPQLLLLATIAELVIYRLLVPALRPRADVAPPLWHSMLAYLGLFLFYFASALAVGVVAHQLWQIAREKGRRIVGVAMLVMGAAFLLLASISIVTPPSARVTFLLEASFVAALVVALLRQWQRPRDLWVAFGMVFLALPLLVHFYAPFSIRFLVGEEALFNGLTDRVEHMGRWLVLFAALTMPYCFGARPFLLRAARLPPLVASMIVALLGASLIRHDYETGMELAQNGLGLSIGPGAPGSMIALCLLALSAVAWTFANCVTAPSEQRRNIGVGLALVIGGGYAFSWPLQYLVGLAGFLTISRAASTVRAEEQALLPAHVPSIENDTWQGYVQSVAEKLRSLTEAVEPINVLTVRGDGGRTRSHLAYVDQNIPITITVERNSGSVVGIDVRCGDADVDGEPCWSLHCNAPGANGLVHPAPPCCSEELVPPADLCPELLDDFVLRGSATWTQALLGDDRCKHLASSMSGWIACWPDGTLRSQIYPGRGASLNHPIPIVALAMNNGDGSPDALASLVVLLAQLARQSHELAGESS